MTDDAIINRVEKFERTVAACLCIVPFLFGAQCMSAALAAPVFREMFAGFGSKLPALTEFVIRSWAVWAAVAVAGPISALIMSRKAPSRTSVVFSTIAGIVMFVIAQLATAALFLPILQLGSVANTK